MRLSIPAHEPTYFLVPITLYNLQQSLGTRLRTLNALLFPLIPIAYQVSDDVPRAIRPDLEALGLELVVLVGRQHVQRRLAHAVSREFDLRDPSTVVRDGADTAHCGRNVDDARVGRALEEWNEGFGDECGAVDVCFESCSEELAGRPLAVWLRAYPGVVDKDVQTAEILFDCFCCALNGGVVVGVELDNGDGPLEAWLGLHVFQYFLALGDVSCADDDVVFW